MEHERKTLNLSIKAVGGDGTFTGLLSTYGDLDEYKDIVEPGAYAKTINDNGGSLPMLWQHDPAQPVGTLALKDTPRGLEVTGTFLLDDDVPNAKMAYALVKAGIVKGLSIGFKPVLKKMKDGIRHLKEIRLFEGSLVTIPANRNALISDVKSFTEAKDFTSELESIQTMDTYCQMMLAFRSALYVATGSGEMQIEEKTTAAGEVIDQFKTAFMEFLPRHLAMVEETPQYASADALAERMAAAPDPIREKLQQFCKQFLALAEHAVTSKEADSAAQPEQKKPIVEDAVLAWAKQFAIGELERTA